MDTTQLSSLILTVFFCIHMCIRTVTFSSSFQPQPRPRETPPPISMSLGSMASLGSIALGSMALPPQPEEELTLGKVLKDAQMKPFLRSYLEGNLCGESIHFLDAVETYDRITQGLNKIEMAQKVWCVCLAVKTLWSVLVLSCV